MKVARLARIDLTTADLDRAVDFYRGALGFVLLERGPANPAPLGVTTIEQAILRRGAQLIALARMDPPGAPYPADASACDQCFQHFALPVTDMAEAYARLAATPISFGGPQHLPRRSGGVTAYKFRDPDGHPLEMLEFPDRRPGGIDHSAIVVTDVARSIAFYEGLGLRLAARQHNAGEAQDRLDGLAHASVEVVALEPPTSTPHVELLAYRAPPIRPAAPSHPNDIAATRLVFEVEGLERPQLLVDPDDHLVMLT